MPVRIERLKALASVPGCSGEAAVTELIAGGAVASWRGSAAVAWAEPTARATGPPANPGGTVASISTGETTVGVAAWVPPMVITSLDAVAENPVPKIWTL